MLVLNVMCCGLPSPVLSLWSHIFGEPLPQELVQEIAPPGTGTSVRPSRTIASTLGATPRPRDPPVRRPSSGLLPPALSSSTENPQERRKQRVAAGLEGSRRAPGEAVANQ